MRVCESESEFENGEVRVSIGLCCYLWIYEEVLASVCVVGGRADCRGAGGAE